MRVHEMAVVHADFLGIAVHQVGEGLLRTGHVFGQGDGRVVAGLDDHAALEFVKADRAVQGQEAG